MKETTNWKLLKCVSSMHKFICKFNYNYFITFENNLIKSNNVDIITDVVNECNVNDKSKESNHMKLSQRYILLINQISLN